jgi:DNA-binding Lrp family transcriptional regulator
LPARLDDTDRLILKLLQQDGRMTNVELASRLGMSPPPCLRRVRALEEAGFIKGYRALVDEKRLGFEVPFFAFVHLASQAGPDLDAFIAHVRTMPAVRASWTLSGDMDFMLQCVAPDMKAFQTFVAEMTALPNVRNVRTALAISQVKDEGAAPL